MSAKLANIVPVLALCAALFCSCGTREELFESYDSCFVPIPSETSDFVLTRDTARFLLPEVYELKSFDYASGEMFCLSCPVICDGYNWFVTPVGYNGSSTEISDLLFAALQDKRNGTYASDRRNFSFYITKSKDCVFFNEAMSANQSLSYHIYLVVREGNDVFYDRAVLVINALTEAQKKEFLNYEQSKEPNKTPEPDKDSETDKEPENKEPETGD